MRLTVRSDLKALNARSGSPQTSAPNPFYRLPGSVLTIDAIRTGSFVDGNAIWYHCVEDGCYYWSGGFNEQAFQLHETSLAGFTPDEQAAILISAVNVLRPMLSKTVTGFQGTGIADKNLDSALGAALTVYVSAKTGSGTVQKAYNLYGISIPTDVKIAWPAERQENYDGLNPFRMGTSITLTDGSAGGTMTAVLCKGGKYFALSCAHVLLPKISGRYQRSLMDTRHAFLPVGASTRKVKGTIEEGWLNNEFDFAVAEIPAAAISRLTNMFGLGGVEVSGYFDETEQAASKGRRVMICGSVSVDVITTILDPQASRRIDDDPFETQGLIITRKVTEHGDSGAPAIDIETKKLVGMVIAASKPGVPEAEQETFILPVHSIMKNLHYNIFKP